jgi:DNA invertase Pin-like site-specific DNA recombinase
LRSCTGAHVDRPVIVVPEEEYASLERDRIRERIRDAKRHLTSQGVFSGGLRPFGYDKVQDGEIVRLVPNPAETAVIERMQTMRRDYSSLRKKPSRTEEPRCGLGTCGMQPTFSQASMSSILK